MNTKKKRLIPVILFKNGNIVQSKNFLTHRIVGNAYNMIDRLNSWNADEIIYLNIRPENSQINLRNDINIHLLKNFKDVVKVVSKKTFVPLTVGGGIKKLNQVDNLFQLGADKVFINSAAYYDERIISKISNKYGSQAVIVGIDIKLDKSKNIYEIYVNNGNVKISTSLEKYLDYLNKNKPGELLINSIHCDGLYCGFDLKLLKKIKNLTNIPIIALGGAGKFSHFHDVYKELNFDAVAAGNIFHLSENSYYESKKYLLEKKIKIMPNNFTDLFI